MSGAPHFKAEYIYRMHDEQLYSIPPAVPQPLPLYPWEESYSSALPRITKEFFRCKGSALNPVHIVDKPGGISQYYDCGGSEKHSLPLRNGKEFVYPILLDLLNYIQKKAQKRVVITSAHRCPEHHMYVDSTPANRSSKHMMGAEVSFYVQGMEEKPDKIIAELMHFYHTEPKYAGKKEFLEFQRYEKNDSQVSTLPWYNKEIFIKLYTRQEGRNFDNRHPYPYISIQVRYDMETQQRVLFDARAAFNNYLRH